MDYKSKVLFWLFFLLMAGAVTVTYLRYYVALDYDISAQADCDPASEKCFVHTCSLDVDGECPADESQAVTYYKNVRKRANIISLCDPNDPRCRALDCVMGMDCEVTYCDDSIVSEGDTCNDPEQYLKDEAETGAQTDSGEESLEAPVCGDDTPCTPEADGPAVSGSGVPVDFVNTESPTGS
ncbi:MAG: hypothetical protein HGA31_01000 [Candidatus Moranbacteria bacterium]|nr:hypothetical protein [Candidatus Moranbacteria bacterium]